MHLSKRYCPLSAEARAMLQIQARRGQSLRSISRLLGTSPSTVRRALARQDSTASCARSAGDVTEHGVSTAPGDDG
ncbi:helix-turn-helix domain-containing protein [Xanthomonas populi]